MSHENRDALRPWTARYPCLLATGAALMALTKADVENVLKARLIIGEALEEVADAKVKRC